MMNLLAQTQDGIQVAPEGGFKGFGKLGLEDQLPTNASLVFSDFISSTIGIITVIAIIWFIFLVITGSFAFMTAGNDKGAIEGARKKLVNGLTGLMVTIFGIFFVRLIGFLIGIPDILNITMLIDAISGNIIR